MGAFFEPSAFPLVPTLNDAVNFGAALAGALVCAKFGIAGSSAAVATTKKAQAKRLRTDRFTLLLLGHFSCGAYSTPQTGRNVPGSGNNPARLGKTSYSFTAL